MTGGFCNVDENSDGPTGRQERVYFQGFRD